MTRRVGSLTLFGVSLSFLVMCAVVPIVWGSGASGLKDALLGTGSFGLPFIFVGLVLTWRRPEHPIGWGFAAAGCFFTLQAASTAYADAALHAGRDLPGAFVAANLTQWIFAPGVYLGFTKVFLLFPDGAELSARWRRLNAAGAVSTVVMSVTSAVAAGPLQNYKQFDNPIGVDVPAVGAMQAVGLVAYIGALFAAAVAVVIRYRRSRGVERLQMRWFCIGAIGTIFAFALMMAMVFLTGDVGPASLLTSLLPICAGIAILRYRLFDIDRIISRTVSYLLVTGLLVAAYVGGVALLTRLGPFSSSVGVATTTLVVAAAFSPLRRRVQAAVDHRFNRARYDAARTIDAFAGRLRDEVDPDVVRHDLLDVAVRAIQPASISLWVAS